MVDIVSKRKRSKMMANIRGKDTRPELVIRKGLHALGFRYRLHDNSLPGSPDLVFPGYMAVIFVNGCFWHRHSCHLFKWPSTRRDFWQAKIDGNAERDRKNIENLRKAGWRVLVVWECALKGKERLDPDRLLRSIAEWLRSTDPFMEIRGRGPS